MSRLSSLPPSCGASRFLACESGNSAKLSCNDWPRRDGMKRSLYVGLRADESRPLDGWPAKPGAMRESGDSNLKLSILLSSGAHAQATTHY